MQTKTRHFDVTEMLQTEEDIAEYLSVVLEDGDPDLLAATLGDIAKARSMNQILQNSGEQRTVSHDSSIAASGSKQQSATDAECPITSAWLRPLQQ